MTDTKFDFPKGMKGSETKVAIYVPSTKNINDKISEKQFKKRIKEVVSFLRTKLGGTTRIAGIGDYYSSELKRPVAERIAKIESYTNKKDYYAVDQDIKKFLETKKKSWSQESIAYNYMGEMFFV